MQFMLATRHDVGYKTQVCDDNNMMYDFCTYKNLQFSIE